MSITTMIQSQVTEVLELARVLEFREVEQEEVSGDLITAVSVLQFCSVKCIQLALFN